MIDWVRKLFGQSNSGATAKERLRLVLMTDHLALAPELIDQMKRDLVEVISRYVEVDQEKVEVNFEREDKALAMLANIPIRAVNRPSGGGGSGEAKPQDPKAEAPAEPVAVEAAAEFADEEPDDAGESTIASGAPPARPRKRRKKGGGQPKPATAH